MVYDVRGQRLATLTNNQGRILLTSEDFAAIKGCGRDRGPALLRPSRRRFRGGSAGRSIKTSSPGRPSRAPRPSRSSSSRTHFAAQDSRTILQKFREAAIAYHLERQWSKDKILTEYLNEIYFGEGATGIEAAARTYFGSAHPGCGQGDAEPCASQLLLPWEAATGRDDLLAEAPALPASQPRGGSGAAQPRAPTDDRGGLSTDEVREVRGARAARRGRHRAAARTRLRRTSPRGCGSSSSIATAPARPSAAASRSPRPSTSSSRTRSSRSP